MKILFDINVLVDVACRWREFPESQELYDRVTKEHAAEGALPGCAYTTLYYILCQTLSKSQALASTMEFRRRLEILSFTRNTAEAAHRLQISDLEDACVAATAFEGDCDVIATRDAKGFAASPIPAKSPRQLLRSLGAK